MGFCITNRNARHWAAGGVPKTFRALKERKEILPLALATLDRRLSAGVGVPILGTLP